MRQSEIIRYYSRKDVSSELVRLAQDREVAVKFREGGFGKRPSILQMPGDVGALSRKGVASFHASEERWINPLELKQESTKRDLDALRKGWDLVLDIDCKQVEWSLECAKQLMKALKWHNVNSASVKFSGGTGFHIGVPFEALKLKNKEIKFPEAPRVIAEYLKEFIKPHLGDKILELEGDVKKIVKKSGKESSEFLTGDGLNPYALLDIDTILISSRHLFRMPYSLNEKQWLVSVPVKKLKDFDLNLAKVENIEEIDRSFLDNSNAKSSEGSELIMQAFDWKKRDEEKDSKEKKDYSNFEFKGKFSEKILPPCVKLIHDGLEDGRKRSLFCLLNLYRNMNLDWTDIEDKILKWNTKNKPPLKSGYVRSQLNWHKVQKSKVPPPNCNSMSYYVDIGVCRPDETCRKIKNPLSYTIVKSGRSRKKRE